MYLKYLVILRGLPGSGKSTLATILSENNKWPIFSIDDYFINPTTKVYEFNFAENHLAYKHCKNQTEKAMQDEIEKIILHNTFTLDWELEPYFKLAKDYNYQVFVATVENYHDGKNQHGVDDEQLRKMASKYKIKLL
jgi:predicted kinase